MSENIALVLPLPIQYPNCEIHLPQKITFPVSPCDKSSLCSVLPITTYSFWKNYAIETKYKIKGNLQCSQLFMRINLLTLFNPYQQEESKTTSQWQDITKVKNPTKMACPYYMKMYLKYMSLG